MASISLIDDSLPDKCELCDKTFSSKATLKHHFSEVHVGQQHPDSLERTRVECEICRKLFSSTKTLKEHTKEQHLGEKIQCEICFIWIRPRRLNEHKTRIHGRKMKHREESDKRQLKCDICAKMFATSKGLKAHTKEQHLSDKLQCKICQRWITPLRYERHMTESHGGQVKCDICAKMFSGATNLKVHIKNQHQSHKSFTCSICGLSLASYASLERHVEAMHSGKSRPRVTCKLCNHSILAENFKRHLKDKCPKRSNTAEKSCSSLNPKGDEVESSTDKQEMEQDQNETLPNQYIDHIVECVLCCLTFSKPEDLLKHITERHSGSRGKLTLSFN